MARRLVKHGDVFELPLPSGAAAVCRVVYKSSYFKNVILIAVHGLSGRAEPGAQTAGVPLATFYCSSASLGRGDWPFLCRTDPRPEDVALSKRKVGGDVWIEDDHVGAPTEADADLPEMGVYGKGILVKEVEHVVLG